MLKANIGMHVMRQGKESYYALLDAGGNWYEQYKECDFLLTKEKQLQFVVTPSVRQLIRVLTQRLLLILSRNDKRLIHLFLDQHHHRRGPLVDRCGNEAV